MNKNKLLINRIIAAALIAFGAVFGGTWSATRFCLGDHVFSALGLPAWSNGTSGTHYPAIVGMAIILAGTGLLNATLPKRIRLWVWGIAILILVIIGFCFTRM